MTLAAGFLFIVYGNDIFMVNEAWNAQKSYSKNKGPLKKLRIEFKNWLNSKNKMDDALGYA